MTSWNHYCVLVYVLLFMVPCARGTNLQINVRQSLRIWAVLIMTGQNPNNWLGFNVTTRSDETSLYVFVQGKTFNTVSLTETIPS